MYNFLLKTLVLFFFSAPFICYSQGKINKSKKDISESSKKSSLRSSDSSDTSLSFMEEIVIESFLYVTYYSLIGSYSSENHLKSDLTPYPFYNNASGNYSDKIDSLSRIKKMRLDIENNFLFESEDLIGNHLKLKIRPVSFFYLQVDYFEIAEFVRINNSYSNLSLFNFNFCYDRIKFDKFNLGWNIGVNYIANGLSETGFSYGFNTEIFLNQSYSLYGSGKWSEINRAPLNEYEIKFKYHKNIFFGTIGYEHLKIGLPTYNFLSLGAGVYF